LTCFLFEDCNCLISVFVEKKYNNTNNASNNKQRFVQSDVFCINAPDAAIALITGTATSDICSGVDATTGIGLTFTSE